MDDNKFIKVNLKRKRSKPISLKVKVYKTTSIYKFFKLKGIKGVREEIDRVKISL